MTAKALISALAAMPPNAEVGHLWDGAVRTTIEHVWMARCGIVVTADHEMVCYYDEYRPASAPTSKENRHWQSPANPNPDQ